MRGRIVGSAVLLACVLASSGPSVEAADKKVHKKDVEFALPSGNFTLRVSVASNKGRFNGGKGIEGIGVPPHEVVPYDPKDLAAGVDTLILRAEELLDDFPEKDVPYRPERFGWEPPKGK